MNKVININLGGYPFLVDEDAYHCLKEYLLDIRSYYAQSPGCEEIAFDIEYRMAELLQDDLGKVKKITSLDAVTKVIATMGTTSDFEGASAEGMGFTSSTRITSNSKKLFRDQENKVIGGVCSGIAAYFGIEDPVWVRLAFVLSIFSIGIGFLPYILLWAFVPVAKSPHDKLRMRGEEINVSSIAKSIEDEINNIGDTISEISNNFKSKKKFYKS